MVSNFRTSVHPNDDNLHVILTGDFDGSSACELLDLLKRYSNGFQRIFVHTDSLEHIHPLGPATFHSKFCALNGNQKRLFFTGQHACRIAPEDNLCF